MSRLRIEHRTVYTYRRAVEFGRHRLVLRPREGHDLRVESMMLEIAPAYHLTWSRDVFSNSIAIVDFRERAAQLTVHSVVEVKRSIPFPSQDSIPPGTIPLPIVYDPLEATIATSYQSVSYPDDLDEIRSWIQQQPELATPTDAEGLLTALCKLIAKQIKYQRRLVKGVQTPSQTLKLGTGSCRDMATLMMDAARIFAFSARFASGYLDCQASEAGRAAMHAWTEVYLPVLGWKGFDPTLGEPVSLKHIVVGVSHHPRGVMPVSGIFTGAGIDLIEMVAQVKIEKLGD